MYAHTPALWPVLVLVRIIVAELSHLAIKLLYTTSSAEFYNTPKWWVVKEDSEVLHVPMQCMQIIYMHTVIISMSDLHRAGVCIHWRMTAKMDLLYIRCIEVNNSSANNSATCMWNQYAYLKQKIEEATKWPLIRPW